MDPTLPSTLSGQPPRLDAVREAARKFEAQALGALLQPAFATVSAGSFGGGAAEGQWRPMLVDAVARQAVRAGQGLGLSDVILRALLQRQAAPQAEEPSR